MPQVTGATGATGEAGATGATGQPGETCVKSLYREIFERWLVAVLLGLLFTCLLLFSEPLSPLRVLDRLGADAAARRAGELATKYVHTKQPPVIFVTIDGETMAQWGAATGENARLQIAGVIEKVRGSGAKLVVLDVVFAGSESLAADKAVIKALSMGKAALILAAPLIDRREGFTDQITPVVLAGPAYPNPLPKGVRFASSQVSEGTDTIVRAIPAAACVEVDRKSVPLPSLAHAVFEELGKSDPVQLDCPGEKEAGEENIIFLLPPKAASPKELPRSWFRSIAANDLADTSMLRNSIVIIGQDHGAIKDQFRTPLGLMPGALVQANAITGMLYAGTSHGVAHLFRAALEIALILVVASIGSVYWLARAKLFARAGQPDTSLQPETSFLAFVLDVMLLTVVMAVATVAVAALTVTLGAMLILRFGIGVATLVPVVAVFLEALTEISANLIHWLHSCAAWLISAVLTPPCRWVSGVLARLYRWISGKLAPLCRWLQHHLTSTHIIVAAFIAFTLGMPPVASAQPVLAGYLYFKEGDRKAFEIRGPSPEKENDVLKGYHHDLYYHDKVFSTNTSTKGTVFLFGDRVNTRDVYFKNPVEVDIPPPADVPPSILRSLPDLWDHLWKELLPRKPYAHSFAQANPVLPDPLFGGGPFCVGQGAKSLSVTWAGGSGPFTVRVLNPLAPDQVLGSQWTPERLAAVDPALAQGGDRRLIRVTDEPTGSVLEYTLTAVSEDKIPSELSVAERGLSRLPQAAWLATSPSEEWRLEGLREVADLAASGDPEAVALIDRLRERSALGTEVNWVMPAGNYANWRYSELSQINKENVKTLRPLWTFSTGVLRGHEGGPLVIGDIMYIHTPFPNNVFALDLNNNGRILWKYEPKQDPTVIPVMCCDTVNRGVAYADGKIFLNQADTTLVALDGKTGKVVWSVKNGDPKRGETATGAPLVVKDRVLVGISGGEFGVQGHVTAYNINDGSKAWRAYSVGPDDEILFDANTTELGRPVGKDSSIKSWQGDQWKIGGGTTFGWYSYDPQLNLIYYGSGNPSTWNPVQRPGDNKWSMTIFARNPDTGVAKWVYQMTPHDQWDYDGVNEMILADINVKGQPTKALVHFDRNGFGYTLNRETGALLVAEKYDPKVNWATKIDMQTGRPEVVAQFAPGSKGEDVNYKQICPAALGSKDQQPAAFSPKTGIFYVPTNHVCMDSEPFKVSYTAGQPYVGAHLSMFPPPGDNNLGNFIAWDAGNGQILWSNPEPFSVWSGALATAGEIVSYGTLEGYLKVVDMQTGKELYRFKTPSAIIGNVNTFSHRGKQYIAVLSGVGGWAGIGMAAGLTEDIAGLGAVGAYKALANYTQLGGVLTVFGLPE